MNNLKISMPRVLLVITLLIGMNTFAQEVQRKVITEDFQVNKDVVLDINTNYTDIEFDTWNKNKVSIEAVLEIDGVSKEEAKEYFRNWEFEALGNRAKVTVKSRQKSEHSWVSKMEDFEIDLAPLEFDFDYDFEIIGPELNENLVFITKELSELPAMPHMDFSDLKIIEFDYEKYKKEGDAYLIKWKAQWEKAYDGDLKKKMEIWKSKMGDWKGKMDQHKKDIKVKTVIIKEKMADKKKALEVRKKELAERKKALEVRKKELAQRVIEAKKRSKERIANKKILHLSGKNKKYNVKRKLKIKMPKDATLKMNVRHGEVKLSDNAGIDANISHTKLYANTIKGKNTTIKASYSPIVVENWNGGNLSVNYNKEVLLKNVNNIHIDSNSSNVTIDQLLNSALINGSFGRLNVNHLTNTFKNLNVILENTDAEIHLPETSYNLQYNGTYSKIIHPKNNQTNKRVFIYGDSGANKAIIINAKYSNVVFK